MITVEIDIHLCSMRLINVKAFLGRERLIRKGKRVDHQAEVLRRFLDDQVIDYAILSHRWTGPWQELDYNEVVGLAKMNKKERNEIRQRDGYRKILQSCQLAQEDGCEWLCVDTCCLDKRSSAELSEAINSMYRWFENSTICYVYLHDVPGDLLFPTVRNNERYYRSNGWPEWFSRAWTLQEMLAPRDVQFFNKDWHPIGDKRMLSIYHSGSTARDGQGCHPQDTLPAKLIGRVSQGWHPCPSLSTAHTEGRTFLKTSVRCSNHIMGCRSGGESSGGLGLFSHGFAGCEHADVVWGGEEGIPPSSA